VVPWVIWGESGGVKKGEGKKTLATLLGKVASLCDHWRGGRRAGHKNHNQLGKEVGGKGANKIWAKSFSINPGGHHLQEEKKLCENSQRRARARGGENRDFTVHHTHFAVVVKRKSGACTRAKKHVFNR